MKKVTAWMFLLSSLIVWVLMFEYSFTIGKMMDSSIVLLGMGVSALSGWVLGYFVGVWIFFLRGRKMKLSELFEEFGDWATFLCGVSLGCVGIFKLYVTSSVFEGCVLCGIALLLFRSNSFVAAEK